MYQENVSCISVYRICLDCNNSLLCLVELGLLTGVAAILRFPLPELDQDDDDNDNDSD